MVAWDPVVDSRLGVHPDFGQVAIFSISLDPLLGPCLFEINQNVRRGVGCTPVFVVLIGWGGFVGIFDLSIRRAGLDKFASTGRVCSLCFALLVLTEASLISSKQSFMLNAVNTAFPSDGFEEKLI